MVPRGLLLSRKRDLVAYGEVEAFCCRVVEDRNGKSKSGEGIRKLGP